MAIYMTSLGQYTYIMKRYKNPNSVGYLYGFFSTIDGIKLLMGASPDYAIYSRPTMQESCHAILSNYIGLHLSLFQADHLYEFKDLIP